MSYEYNHKWQRIEDDYYDRDWWSKSIDLGEGWEVSHDVECPHCEKAFEIEKFEH